MTIKSSNDIIAALKGRKLMLILGTCVVSSVVSVIVVRYNEFRMYKDTTDKGYKINTKKVLNNTNQNKRKQITKNYYYYYQ